MNPITQTIKERDEIFKKFGSIHTDRPMPSGMETFSNIESHITQTNIALLESVVVVVEGMKKEEAPDMVDSKGINRDYLIKGYSLALQSILTELQGALKELKDNK